MHVWFRTWREVLFVRGGIDGIFAHTRNFIVASFIVGAGTYATRAGDSLEIASVLHVRGIGYVVTAAGVALLVLNLADGLYRLSTFKRHTLLQILLMAIYLFLSVRLAQLLIAFQG